MATWQEFLSSSPQVCGGEICATGTRIPVTVILDSLAEGADKDEVLASYPSRRSAFDTQMGSEATNSLGFNPCRPVGNGNAAAASNTTLLRPSFSRQFSKTPCGSRIPMRAVRAQTAIGSADSDSQNCRIAFIE